MRYLIIVLTIAFAGNVYSCDFCGCNPSTAAWDQQTGVPANFVQHTLFVKNVRFSDPDSDLSQSMLFGQLLTGAWSPSKKFEIRATVPVLMIANDFGESGRTPTWGLGDILLQTNVLLLNKTPFGSKKWGHKLLAFGGAELPTGNYVFSEDPLLGNVAFGSKSFDFIAGAFYKASKFKGSFSAGTNAKLNTQNREELRFGHQWSAFAQGGYILADKHVRWELNLGTRYDLAGRNVLRSIYQNKTGGQVWQLTTGLSAKKGSWNWNFLYQQPLVQENGNGVFQHSASLFTSVAYQFNAKFKNKQQ